MLAIFYRIAFLTGAGVLSLVATGYAQNQEIWQVQGAGLVSPVQFSAVTLPDNIVTAVGNGFFCMQTPAERTDGDPATSDGIVVNYATASGLVVGQRVTVSGLVREVEGLTAIDQAMVQVVNALPGPLPDAVALTPSFPSTLALPVPDQERVEGMRVSYTAAQVCAPSNSNDVAALSFTTTLPQREPGIRWPGQAGLPVWDGNPEICWFDPDALGAPNNRFLSVGMQVSGTGILIQDGARYTIWPVNYSTAGSALVQPVPPANPQTTITVGSFNALQLRLDANDYLARVQKIARYLVEALHTPDVVALQEVGSLTVLQDLSYYVSLLAPGVNYRSFLLTGFDDINLGFLVAQRLQNPRVEQLGKDEFLSIGGRLHDRPPLLLRATLPTTPPTPLAVLNVHLRSLLGIEGAEATFVRTKRHEQALSLAGMVQDLQTENLVVVGDFNAFPFTDGYVDVLNQVTGQPTLGALFPVLPLVSPPLVNQSLSLPAAEQYSYIFDGSAQLLDHCLTNQLTNLEVSGIAYARGNSGAASAFYPNNQLIQRSSDHDGLVLYLQPTLPVATTTTPNAQPWLQAPNPMPARYGWLQLTQAPYPTHWQLLNAAGQPVWHAHSPAGSARLELPNLAPGWYVLRGVADAGALVNLKLVVVE